MGRDATLIAQATSAGRASRSRCLLRMGRNEVKIVAISAKRTAILDPQYCMIKEHVSLSNTLAIKFQFA